MFSSSHNLYPYFDASNSPKLYCFEITHTKQRYTIPKFSLSSSGKMALYIRRPRLGEEGIGRGMPSVPHYKNACFEQKSMCIKFEAF